MSAIELATPDDPLVASSALSSPSCGRFLIAGSTIAAAVRLPTPLRAKGDSFMSSITTKDGVEIFYKDWGKGQPIVPEMTRPVRLYEPGSRYE